MKIFTLLILFIPFSNLFSAEKYHLLCDEEFIQIHIKNLKWSKFSAENYNQMEEFNVENGKLRIEEKEYRLMVQVQKRNAEGKYVPAEWYTGYGLDRTTLELQQRELGLVNPYRKSDPLVICMPIEESLFSSMKNTYLNMKKESRKSRLEKRKI